MALGDLTMMRKVKVNKRNQISYYFKKNGSYGWFEELAERLEDMADIGVKEIIEHDLSYRVPLSAKEKALLRQEAFKYRNYRKRLNYNYKHKEPTQNELKFLGID